MVHPKDKPEVKSHSHVGLLDADQTNGKTLKLTTRKVVDITVGNLAQL